MTLRYPSDLNFNDVDYVTFQAHEYRSNASGEAGPPVGPRIMLYMPNSTPQVSNNNNWGEMSFGEGQLGREIGGLVGDAMSVGESAMEGGNAVGDFLDKVKGRFESIKSNGSEVIGQVGMNAMASIVPGASAGQILAVTKGEVYNPNIELAYQGPGLRNFSFDFNFIPKNPLETIQINQIIKTFKQLSSSSDKGAALLKVPNVWQVTYMSNGAQNVYMNAFKRASLTSVSVKANSNTSMHQSFVDGMPVSTSIALQFREVDIILSDDHDKSGTLQGY